MATAPGRFRDTVRIRIPLEFRKKDGIRDGAILGMNRGLRKIAPARHLVDLPTDPHSFAQQLLMNIYDGLMITGLKGNIIKTNARANAILGYTDEEFGGSSVIDLIDGADEAVLSTVIENVQQETFTMIEGFCIRRDGSKFPAEITVNIIRLPHREYLCFFIRDITKRMQMEIELLRLGTAVDSAGDGICITDVHARQIYHQNPAFEKLTGYPAGVLDGMGGLTRLYAPDAIKYEIIAAVRHRGVWSGELEAVCSQGDKIPVFLRANVIKDTEGDPIGLICVHSDMTERRKAEMALRRARDELERRVEERTCELVASNTLLQNEVVERKRAQDELRRYAEELEQRNEELQQFGYVASHDLREPLRAITSYLQLLERRYKGELGAEADKFINRAVAAAQRMTNLISGLLEYSRVGTGDSILVPTECQAAVNAVLEDLRAPIEESGAVIACEPLPTIEAVTSQIQQVFQNLISNAVKFRGPAAPRITISAVRLASFEPNARVGNRLIADSRLCRGWLFAVKDNGIGFDNAQSDRIFRIFHRLHTEGKYPGTGIGLPVCRKIVEGHGGEIWADSCPGQGTTFYFTLPETGSVKHAR